MASINYHALPFTRNDVVGGNLTITLPVSTPNPLQAVLIYGVAGYPYQTVDIYKVDNLNIMIKGVDPPTGTHICKVIYTT